MSGQKPWSGQNPDELAAAMVKVLASKSGEQVRHHFKEHFTVERHLADLAAAIRSATDGKSSRLAAGAAALTIPGEISRRA